MTPNILLTETEKEKRKLSFSKATATRFNFQLPLPQPVGDRRPLFHPPDSSTTPLCLWLLTWATAAYWGMEYTLPKGESYVVRLRMVQNAMADIVQEMHATSVLTGSRIFTVRRKEKCLRKNSGIYYKFAGGSVEHLSESKNERGTPVESALDRFQESVLLYCNDS